ncbi:major facilitator superfamily domain-containing protein [Lipomyces japonicus]|uniref:major facilitator superfamily domain-containing protein n=1 Tax=Lipomyces japonicus TaxID=56871 RepID=UPI0034CE6CBD
MTTMTNGDDLAGDNEKGLQQGGRSSGNNGDSSGSCGDRGGRNSTSTSTSSSTSHDVEKLSEDAQAYPEGGLQAWLVVFGSWCAMFGAFGIWNSVGIFQAWLATHQLKDHTEGEISWIFSIFSFLFFFCGVQIGPIFDRYGLRVLVLCGSIGFVLSIMLFSICTKYWHFILAFSLLGGVSCSFMFTPSIAAINHWFLNRRGVATGIGTTGGGFGGVIFPLILQSVIGKIGFGWAIRTIGLICLITSVLAVIFLKTRLPPNPTSSATIDVTAFKLPEFTFTALAIFMIEWALLIPQTYYTSFCISTGVNETLAYQLVAIMNGASIVGRFAPGYVADKWGRYNLMIITAFLCAVFTLAIWLPAAVIAGNGSSSSSPVGAVIAYMVVFGFSSGSGISLTPVCLSQICDLRDYGKRYGTVYSLAALGSLTGVPIAGQILKLQNGDYSGLIIFCGACYITSTMLFVLAKGFGKNFRITSVF